jgi:RHS repeat-associated protein
LQGNIISPDAARNVLVPSPVTRAAVSSFAALAPLAATATDPEITELARGLRNDVDLIYQHIHDNFRFELAYGQRRGAVGSIIDRAGNSFDLANVMVSLLRASGYTANLVHGTIQLDAAQTSSFLGTSDPNVLGRLLGNSGIPGQITIFSNATLAFVTIEHVWVKVTINGTDYVFDPAFKTHTLIQPVNLSTAMGYNQADVLNASMTGASLNGTAIQNLNRQNLQATLQQYAGNLVNFIKTNKPAARLEDIIGGKTIQPVPAGSPVRQTALPYQASVIEEWTDIPDTYKCALRIRYLGIDQTLLADQIYGKRLTITYNGNIPQLNLEGQVLQSGTSTALGINTSVAIDINQPYPNIGGAYGDSSGSQNIVTGGTYFIQNAFSVPSKNMVDYHRNKLRVARQAGAADNSEEVLGESLAISSFAWIAQSGRAIQLADQVRGLYTIQHNSVGIVGFNGAPYVDIPFYLLSNASLTNDAVENSAAFFNGAGIGSAFESGIIEQIHNFPAASTVSLLDLANIQQLPLFDASTANWATIQPQLTGYDAFTLASIQAYINAGYRVILPGAGNLLVGSWQGVGYLTISPSEDQIGHQISGGLNGGFASQPQTDAQFVSSSNQVQGTASNTSSNSVQGGDPISLAVGDYIHENTDMTVGSNPYPFGLGFKRSYTSGAALIDGPMGLGWTHNFDIHVRSESDGYQGMGEDSPIDAAAAIVALYTGNDILRDTKTLQKVMIATLVQNWFMDNLIGNVANVVQPGDSQQFVRLADGSYNPPPSKTSNLSVTSGGSFVYRTKHGVELDFDSSNRLAQWLNPDAVKVLFSYDSNGLKTVNDAFHHSLSFQYANNRISSVTDGNGRTVSYAYDSQGNLTGFTDAEGNTTQYTYASPGKLSQLFKPSFPATAFISNSYDGLGRVMEQRSANNQLWQYFYSGLRTDLVDPLGNTTTRYFNSYGRVLKQIDPLGKETVAEFDGLERNTKTTLPEGNSTELTYDGKDNVTQITLRPKPGSLLAPITRQFAYHPTWNQVSSATDALGRVTTYNYDNATGHLLSVVLPQVGGQSPVKSYTYNNQGQVTTTTDPTGMVNRVSYDPATGDILASIEDDGGLAITTNTGYDAVGNRINITDPNGHTTTMTYDKQRRLKQTTAPQPFNFITQSTYDSDGRLIKVEKATGDLTTPWQVTEKTYTVFGATNTISEPGGRMTTFQYDAVDRVSQITDPEGRIVRKIYDAAGQLTGIDDVPDLSKPTIVQNRATYAYSANGKQTALTDGNGNTTLFVYDGFDRPLQTTYADGKFESVTLDAEGNKLQRKTRAGDSFIYSYDALNRLKTENEPYTTTDITYAYDLAGRLTSVTDSHGITSYAYDSAGRLESTTRPDLKTVSYNYDSSGNRTRLTWPDNYFVEYQFDEINRVSRILENGTLTLATYGYDALSRQASINFGNGTTTTYNWQPVDNDLDGIKHQFATEVLQFNHTYNLAGQRASQSISDNRYQWQPASTKNDVYVSNLLNQYTSVGATNYSYDLNANLSGNGSNTFTFDAKNRLVDVITPAYPNGISYDYDPFNRRISKTVNNTTTSFLHDGALEIAEYDQGSDALLQRYVYGPGQLAPIVRVTPAVGGGSASHSFLHTDAIGSVVAVTNGSNSVSEQHGYSPFGEDKNISGIPFRFTGQRFDPETGLYYFRARYYDAQLGRFLSVDPLGAVDGPNLYAYVGNDPVNFIDPLGLNSEKINNAEINNAVSWLKDNYSFLFEGDALKVIDAPVSTYTLGGAVAIGYSGTILVDLSSINIDDPDARMEFLVGLIAHEILHAQFELYHDVGHSWFGGTENDFIEQFQERVSNFYRRQRILKQQKSQPVITPGVTLIPECSQECGNYIFI